MKWRETGRTVKVVWLDARAILLPCLILIMYLRLWTITAAILWIVAFVAMQFYGYSMPNFLRRMRVLLFFGRRRSATPFWKKNKWD